MKKIVSFLTILVIITSCKKYEEDKFFSTYTVKSRLEKGGWSIYEVEDLVLNKKFIPENSSNAYSFDEKLTQYTQILKPSILNQMTNQSDSIIINDFTFELSNDKNKIIAKKFLACGYYLYPQYTQGFTIHHYLDIEFIIKKLEFGYMTLLYNNRLIFRFKKVL